ncbi:MAG: PIN domain-containing protein [Desulfamplus sp.]|nr:PIN domain-containing protein [Desulfamplus sp.]
MKILVDTSVWIDYFRTGLNSGDLDILIDENILVINDIILAELIPFLKVKKQNKVIQLLNYVTKLDLDIDWSEIIQFQVACLQSGLNGIGIPDLIIAQNSLQYYCQVYTLDKHLKLLKDIIDLHIYND